MERVKLQAKLREVAGKGLGQLRAAKEIPAVVYGKGKENRNLTVGLLDFEKVYREVGTSAILRLSIEGDGEKNVLIHRMDFDAITNAPLHIDFYEVSMREKITTVVPLAFVGDSIAVIELGGSLVTNKDEVEIECLPGDLPHNIEVDIAVLDEFEKAIHVSDIVPPQGVEIKDEPEEMVATVEPPRTDEELAELEEPVEAPEIPESEHGEAPEAAGEESEEKSEE